MIVKTVTHLTIGLIFIFGCYLTMYGHMRLGGGLAGGVALALAYILYVLAYGKSEAEERLNQRWAVAICCGSFLTLLLIALIGYFSGYFFCNFLPKTGGQGLFSSGTVLLLNFLIMLIVGSGLYSAFLTLITFRVKARKEE